MVLGTAAIWVPVTLSTPPVEQAVLKQFYARVKPPGFWGYVGIAAKQDSAWKGSLIQWFIGTVGLLAATIGPLQLMVGPKSWGWFWCGIAGAAWSCTLKKILRRESAAAS